MLERIAYVLDLFLDKLLLLLLNVELLLTVVCECEVVDVLYKLLCNILETLVSTGQKEESLNIFIASTLHGSLQRCDFLVNTAVLIGKW